MYPEVTSVYIPIKNKDYRTLAILLSVVGHIALLGAIVYFHNESPPPPMQTVLISPQELADMQSLANQNNQSSQDNSQDKSETTTAKSQPTDPDTAKIMQQIAEQEALFQQHKAQIAEQLDKEFYAEQQRIVEELDAELAQKQATIAEFEQAQANLENIQANLKAEMDEAKRRHMERLANQQIKAENKDISSDGERLPTVKSGNATGARTASQGANVSNYRDAIVSKIYSNWNPPTNSAGKSLRVTLRLSSSGDVISSSIGSDDPFAKSLKDAINKSSPLPVPTDPELFQKSFATLTVKFEGK